MTTYFYGRCSADENFDKFCVIHFSGLTIDDLNRYLPALQTINDIHMDSNNMKEGMFLTKSIGLLPYICCNPPVLKKSHQYSY